MPASVSYFDFQRQKDDRYFKPIFYCQSIRSKTYSRWQKTNHPGVRRFKSSPRPFIFVRYANSQDLKISVGVHERIPLVSGCSLEYRAREMSGVSLLLLQETEPYFQDSGEDRTSSSILETTIWFEGCRHQTRDVQCDAESSRRTLIERRRITIPGRSSNISIIVQAIDSIF
jgi:hypothetical protein